MYRASPRLRRRWFASLTTSALTTTVLSSMEVAAWVSSSHISPCYHRPTRQLSLHTLSTPREQEMTQHALQIVKKGIQAVDPVQAVRAHFRLEDDCILVGPQASDAKDPTMALQNYDEVVLVAFGKASSAMATTVVQQLDARIPCSGLVICKDDHGTAVELEILCNSGIEVRMASHPVPDQRSVEGAAALMNMVKSKQAERTLVICCISGGGSALFCQPRPPLTLQDLQVVNSALLASGMGIQEMNIIRKRLEEGKGGKLAAACYPSRVVTLVLSDVLGDPLDLIASGPTVPDSSTWKDAWEIVQQYQMEHTLPESVVEMMQAGLKGELPDSPTPDHPIFVSSKTVLVGNNALAIEAAAREAQALGYNPVVLGTQIQGEAKEIPHIYTAMALHLQEQADSPFSVSQSLPVAIVAGGETTVSIPANCKGKGGRNQELALSAGILLDKLDLRNVVIASVGTDGTDGPTDAAGAVVDATTVRNDLEGARKALSSHNSYQFLGKLASNKDVTPLIKTGPTGTNVADICVTLVDEAPFSNPQF